jgi:ribonuclease P/MRP protein subunit POP3
MQVGTKLEINVRRVLTTSSLVTPLGDHRRNYIQPSKGKKRKRNTKTAQNDSTLAETAPPLPEVDQHLLIGLNSVTRHLEALAARNAPTTAPVAFAGRTPVELSNPKPEDLQTSKDAQEVSDQSKQHDDPQTMKNLRPLSIVILTHPKPSLSPAHAHIPTLLHLSTLSASTPSTRLISLPTSTDALLASALHIPRVGALAIYEGAPGAKALENYVRDNVGVTECKWIDEAISAEWRGLNVKSEVPGAKMDEKKWV